MTIKGTTHSYRDTINKAQNEFQLARDIKGISILMNALKVKGNHRERYTSGEQIIDVAKKAKMFQATFVSVNKKG